MPKSCFIIYGALIQSIFLVLLLLLLLLYKSYTLHLTKVFLNMRIYNCHTVPLFYKSVLVKLYAVKLTLDFSLEILWNLLMCIINIIMHLYILTRVGPDTFLARIPDIRQISNAGYPADFKCRILDIRLISNAGYPIPSWISGQRLISGKLPDIRLDNRISGIINQPDIRPNPNIDKIIFVNICMKQL